MFSFIQTIKAQTTPIGAVPTIGGIYDLFIKALNWLFAFSLVIAIIILISVGMHLYFGGSNADSRARALQRLYYTMAGVGVIFLAWIIVTQIIPRFLGLGEISL